MDIGTSLFYQMAGRMEATVIRFQPTIQFFSSCIEILGKVNWITFLYPWILQRIWVDVRPLKLTVLSRNKHICAVKKPAN